MERSFFLKKRRADFVAGGLSGRVIVAGGLGKDGASQLCCVVALGLGRSLALHWRDRWYLLQAYLLLIYSKEFNTVRTRHFRTGPT